MPLPNGGYYLQGADIIVQNITSHSTNSSMAKTQITRSIDGDWS